MSDSGLMSSESQVKMCRFKMLMLKSILLQVQARDWFVTVDMKNDYFA